MGDDGQFVYSFSDAISCILSMWDVPKVSKLAFGYLEHRYDNTVGTALYVGG